MVDVIKFKEPERCDYLYIDENNKVHILLPIVGGDEIGLDNTCQTAVELITFFYGSAHSGVTKYSAEHQLSEYKRQLEEDIKAINSQKKISPHAYDDLLKEKIERLQQIEKYIELIQVLKKQYDEKNDIRQLRTGGIPQLPSGVKEIIKSSENAFAVRLSPYDNDKFTRFDDPLFNVKRNISKYDTPSRQAPIPIYEGLGYRLRSTLFPEDKTPTPINKKSSKEKIVETVLAQVDADYMKDGDKEQKLEELKKLIQQELVKIDSNLSVNMSRDGKEVNLSYLDIVMALDDDSTIKDWIEGIIEVSIDPTVWEAQASSPFYDGAKEIKSDHEADRISIRVQYLLAEANIYCKTNKLSDANFGEFFDKEPHATEIAKRVKEGFTQGAEIEPIIYDYINSNHAELGLKSPLTSEQQQEITEKFTRHYNTIKESPHFDEFFVADPDKKGNIFSHQGRISCHFLDFFTRQTKGKHPLGDLASHQEALQEGTSNRLHHKNEVVAQGYEKLDQFKKEVVKLLAENKPKELLVIWLLPHLQVFQITPCFRRKLKITLLTIVTGQPFKKSWKRLPASRRVKNKIFQDCFLVIIYNTII